MGIRGPKPTALVLFEGNPGKRRLNRYEPNPRDIAARCPAHLDAERKKNGAGSSPAVRPEFASVVLLGSW